MCRSQSHTSREGRNMCNWVISLQEFFFVVADLEEAGWSVVIQEEAQKRCIYLEPMDPTIGLEATTSNDTPEFC